MTKTRNRRDRTTLENLIYDPWLM